MTDDAKVILIDDLLATGGTLAAGEQLIKTAGATVVGSAVIFEIDVLQGKEKLSKPVLSLFHLKDD